MKCPACNNQLVQKHAGEVMLDVCYGGCGGIWFDAHELQRLDARGASTIHTIWQAPGKKVDPNQLRVCPRCDDQVMLRREFHAVEKIVIDECPSCNGLWLDDGEFTRLYQAMKGARVVIPGLGPAVEAAVRHVRPEYQQPSA
jgi:Zn-finger nucleic acid-binding protein